MQLIPRSGSGSSSSSNYLQSFVKLVATLRHTKSTCTVVEQSCGGLISASILMQPGASQCYIGSSVIYNTVKCQPLVLTSLNRQTTQTTSSAPSSLSQLFRDQLSPADRHTFFPTIENDDHFEEVQKYIESKIQWTAQMAVQYCTAANTDYAVAEGGAVGPTFRPSHLHHGFSVICLAGRRRQQPHGSTSSNNNHHDSDDTVSILRQEIVFSSLPSSLTSRIQNMYTFAQTAAEICHEVVLERSHEDIISDDNNNNNSGGSSSSCTDRTDPVISTLSPPPPFAAATPPAVTFDRSAPQVRSNSTRLEELWSTNPNTKFLLLYKNKMLIRTHPKNQAIELAYQSRAQLQEHYLEMDISFFDRCQKVLSRMGAISFLGRLEGPPSSPQMLEASSDTAVFAIDVATIFQSTTPVVPHAPPPQEEEEERFIEMITAADDELSFVDTRSTLPLLFNQNDQEVVLYGTALMEWKRRNKFCSSCGHHELSYRENGGTVGKCLECQTKFWPRQDPSMIVLIVSRDRQRVLLANHARHQHKKIYTTLAGFVEVGETMESAVVREVYEETGIRVDTTVPMQYIGTQPWPFPQSCMIGFIATTDDRTQQITIDPNEIYDAQWFSKEDIMAASLVVGSTLQTQVTERAFQQNPNLLCVIPPKGVIARKLIDTWLFEDGSTEKDAGTITTTATTASPKYLHDDATNTAMSDTRVHRVRLI